MIVAATSERLGPAGPGLTDCMPRRGRWCPCRDPFEDSTVLVDDEGHHARLTVEKVGIRDHRIAGDQSTVDHVVVGPACRGCFLTGEDAEAVAAVGVGLSCGLRDTPRSGRSAVRTGSPPRPCFRRRASTGHRTCQDCCPSLLAYSSTPSPLRSRDAYSRCALDIGAHHADGVALVGPDAPVATSSIPCSVAKRQAPPSRTSGIGNGQALSPTSSTRRSGELSSSSAEGGEPASRLRRAGPRRRPAIRSISASCTSRRTSRRSARSSFALRAVESASTAASGVAKVRCSAAASASGRARSRAGRDAAQPGLQGCEGGSWSSSPGRWGEWSSWLRAQRRRPPPPPPRAPPPHRHRRRSARGRSASALRLEAPRELSICVLRPEP